MSQPEISGRRVAGLRDKLGLKQDELAPLVGCSTSQLRNIERGRSNPGMFVLFRMVAILGVGDVTVLQRRYDDDDAEYNDARYGNSGGAFQGDADPLHDLRRPGMPLDPRGGEDEARTVVQSLPGPVRTHPGERRR